MKKHLFAILTLLVLCVVMTVSVSAAGTSPRLMDAAGLLTEEEAASLLAELDAASDRAQYDIVVVTVTSLEGVSAEDAAVQIFDSYEFGYGGDTYGVDKTYDGTLFLISMEERETRIESFGIGQYVIDSRMQDRIFDAVIPSLSEGNYYLGFLTYASLTERTILNARDTGSYDNYYDDPAAWGLTEDPYSSTEKAPFSVGTSLVASLCLSLLIAVIATGRMKNQLKTVRQQSAASDYVKRDSLSLTESRERFLYSNVSRIPKPTNNTRSSHSGSYRPSSGGHSGSSHKF